MRKVCLLLSIVVLHLSPNSDLWARQVKRERHSAWESLVYWHGDPSRKQVALTFDDGPHPDYTVRILDILAEQKVKATFFVTGRNVDHYPQIARRIVEEGHAIGNHGYSHHELKILSQKRIRREIEQGRTAIERATDESTNLFRPAYGMFNRKVLTEIKNANNRLIQWSLSPKDWRHPREQAIIGRVMSRVKNGSIILLHDSHPFNESGKREPTVKALSPLIRALHEDGYELVTVPELLALKPTVLVSTENSFVESILK